MSTTPAPRPHAASITKWSGVNSTALRVALFSRVLRTPISTGGSGGGGGHGGCRCAAAAAAAAVAPAVSKPIVVSLYVIMPTLIVELRGLRRKASIEIYYFFMLWLCAGSVVFTLQHLGVCLLHGLPPVSLLY